MSLPKATRRRQPQLKAVCLELQPDPVEWFTAKFGIFNLPYTLIHRVWRLEDLPRCTLCPRCSAHSVGSNRAQCYVLAKGEISRAAAARYVFVESCRD